MTSADDVDRERFVERMRHCASLVGSVNAWARRSGIPNSTLQSFLRDREPRRVELRALADAAGVSLEWLLTGEGPMQRDGLLPDHVRREMARKSMSASQALASAASEVNEEKRMMLGETARPFGAAIAAPPALGLIRARAAVIAAARAAGFPPESDVDFVATMMARLIAGEISEEAVTDAFRFYSLGKKPKGET